MSIEQEINIWVYFWTIPFLVICIARIIYLIINNKNEK